MKLSKLVIILIFTFVFWMALSIQSTANAGETRGTADILVKY